MALKVFRGALAQIKLGIAVNVRNIVKMVRCPFSYALYKVFLVSTLYSEYSRDAWVK